MASHGGAAAAAMQGVGTAATGAASSVQGAGRSISVLGIMLKQFAIEAVMRAGEELVKFGVESVKMAGDFQASMTRLVTSAGLAPSSLAAVSAGILKMSVDTGTSTDQLSKGMFNVESALHLGAGGLQVLKAAAEGARAENSDLAQTTDVLTTAMVNYRLPASQAADVMNSLIVTVAAGKLHMDDLTGSLKNVLPVAAAFHIKLGDVEGALATMANAGDRGTSAGTHLAMMFKMLSSPVGAAKKEMADMGLDSIKLAQTLQTSLPDALKMIQDAVSKHFTPGSVEYNRAILAILGGSKSGVAGLEIMNQGLKVLGKNTDDAAAALRKGSTDVANWSTIQDTFNFKMDQAKMAASAFMIVLGTELLPIFGKLLDQITPMITNFITWETKTHGVENAVKSLVDGLSTLVNAGIGIVKFFKDNEAAGSALEAVLVVLAGVGIILMVQALVTLGIAVGAATVPMLPMIATIALVSLAVFGVIELIKNWGAIMDWLTGKTKESQLQQQQLNERNKLKTIQTQEEQKRGVLANMEDERTQLIAKIKGMADGADKSREQIRLSALNAQIATTKGDIKALDDEKAQHLKILKDLQAQDPQIREQTKIASIQKQLDTKNGVLTALDDEKTKLIKKITDEKDGSAKQRDLMALDAVNAQIATTTGTIKALTDEGNQHKQKLDTMKTADLESRKNWYVRANDALSAWVDSQDSKVGQMVGSWMSALGTWVHGNLSRLGEMIGGWMSGLGTWVNNTISTAEGLPGKTAIALGGLASALIGVIQSAASMAVVAAINAGSDIVNGIASGIMGAIGAVTGAIGSVAAAIADHLPHSPAKVGPLVGLEDMGATISKQLARGMQKSIPTIQAAMQVMLSPIIGPGGTPSSGGVPLSQQQNITIIVNQPDIMLDGQRLTNVQMPYIVQGIRVATGTRL